MQKNVIALLGAAKVGHHGNSPACKKRRFLTKTLLVMKLTIFLLTAVMVNVSARGLSQSVTFSGKNVSLEKVFSVIKQQTGYTFFYRPDLLKQDNKLSLEIRNLSLTQALDYCFKDQPFTYSITGQIITLEPKPQPKLVSYISNEVQPDTTLPSVSGIVKDTAGASLAGASVKIRGTSQGTSTNTRGEFTLKAKPGDMLVFSHVGFVDQQIRITDNNIMVVLRSTNSVLDEVQVIAYGTTTARLSTANVSTVRAEDIAKQPVTNPLLALQGRVPGMLITQRSGLAGSGVEVRIQGQNSLMRGTDPFIVIDGVPYINHLNILSSYSLSYGNPLNYINPADIESIDILKDADATSIYGSRAASGAILITTKKGKAGKTKVDLNFQQGWAEVGHKLDLLNTQQYIAMRREALKNDNIEVRATDYDINGIYDSLRYTDWQEELIGGTAQYTTAQASVSGGNSNTQFLASGTYHRETNVFPGSYADQKGSFHSNINHASLNNKFKVQLNSSYQIDDNKQPMDDLTGLAVKLVPNAPALYTKEGELNWEPLPDGTSAWQNPLYRLNNPYHNKTENLRVNTIISYEIIRGLELKASFGFSKLQTDETVFEPMTMRRPEWRDITKRYAKYSNSSHNSWIIEPQVSYKKIIWKGNLSALVGGTIDQRNNKLASYRAEGFNSDAVMTNPQAATTVASEYSSDVEYKYCAVFGQVNYNLMDKYIINFSARRDGSSRFGSENMFHNFGSVGVGWLFSNEPFIKNLSPHFSFGKLKASYGTTGNDQIGDYETMSLYYNFGQVQGYQGIRGLEPGSFSNPYLQWEETRKLNIGATLGFISDKVLLDLNYYLYRSSNQLLSYNLPILTGFSGISSNFPATIQNTGLEISLNTTNISSKSFQWKTGFNITFRNNKLVEFPGLETSSYSNDYKIGHPITMTRRYRFLGVDPSTGLYSYEDSHGNPTFNPDYMSDRNIFINTQPKFFGGFQNSFIYKQFQLDILFNYVKQRGADYTYGNHPGSFNNNEALGNQPASVLDRWQKNGDEAIVQRFSVSEDINTLLPLFALGASEAELPDASYIKLKNVSLSWTLPEKLSQKAHLQSARVFIQGQNIFTITNYYGLDPETLNNNGMPTLRTITIGCQIIL